MYCSHCGTANQAGFKFCRGCGQPLIAVPAGAPPAVTPIGHTAGGAPPAVSAGGHSGTVHPGHGAAGVAAPASASAQPGGQLDLNTILFWYNKYKPYAWIFWSAVLLIYIVLTKNVMVAIIGLAITWLIRTYCTQIDKALGPIWPVRNLIPVQTRKLLRWVVPVAFAFYVGLQPAIWPKLGWLPLVGPMASMTILMALIGAFAAYVLVREPAHPGIR
jgi:zinc-ribbon domain